MKIYKRPGLLLLVFYLTISAVWGQKNVKGSGYVLKQQISPVSKFPGESMSLSSGEKWNRSP